MFSVYVFPIVIVIPTVCFLYVPSLFQQCIVQQCIVPVTTDPMSTPCDYTGSPRWTRSAEDPRLLTLRGHGLS